MRIREQKGVTWRRTWIRIEGEKLVEPEREQRAIRAPVKCEEE